MELQRKKLSFTIWLHLCFLYRYISMKMIPLGNVIVSLLSLGYNSIVNFLWVYVFFTPSFVVLCCCYLLDACIWWESYNKVIHRDLIAHDHLSKMLILLLLSPYVNFLFLLLMLSLYCVHFTLKFLATVIYFRDV
jgi:hypothetical protein